MSNTPRFSNGFTTLNFQSDNYEGPVTDEEYAAIGVFSYGHHAEDYYAILEPSPYDEVIEAVALDFTK